MRVECGATTQFTILAHRGTREYVQKPRVAGPAHSRLQHALLHSIQNETAKNSLDRQRSCYRRSNRRSRSTLRFTRRRRKSSSRSQLRFLQILRRKLEPLMRRRGPRPSQRPSRASWQLTNLPHFRPSRLRPRPRPRRSPKAVTGMIIVSNRATMVIEKKVPLRLDFFIQAPPNLPIWPRTYG